MSALQTLYGFESPPAVILAAGPHETDGDGGFEYVVCFGDANGDPLEHNSRAIWKLWDYEDVQNFIRKLAAEYHLEIEDDTCRP